MSLLVGCATSWPKPLRPRYLIDDAKPATLLKSLRDPLSRREFEQVLFLYTCRANAILADFVRDVYWAAYSAGRSQVSNEEARAWVVRANQDGKTAHSWSAETIERVAGYLTRCCADFGLLQGGAPKRGASCPTGSSRAPRPSWPTTCTSPAWATTRCWRIPTGPFSAWSAWTCWRS